MRLCFVLSLSLILRRRWWQNWKQRFFHRSKINTRRETLNDLPFLVAQETREIPLAGVDQKSALLTLEPLPQRRCVAAVDVDLRQGRKFAFRPFRAHVVLCLFVAECMLAKKLRARKCENLQSARRVLDVQCRHRLEAALRLASRIGNVDRQDALAAEL